MDTTTDRSALEQKLIPELQRIAQEMGIEGTQRLRKAGLIDAIVAQGGNGAGEGAASPAQGAVAVAERTAADELASATDTAEGAEAGGAERGVADAGRDRSGDEDGDRDEDRGRGHDRSGDGDRGRNQDRSQNQDRNQNQDRSQNQGGDRNQNQGGSQERNRRQRPSREDRRRMREERRLREEQERAEEMKNAPTQTGILDLLPDGYGFLRTSGYAPGSEDIYVSVSQVRKASLRKGDVVAGKVRRPRDNEKYLALLDVETVNGVDPEQSKQRPNFDKLTPLFPDERFRLESGPTAVTERIIDMIAPIGKGQRGMVVSPPKAGKTTILKQIANGILNSNPEVHLIVLLVDERPEEVTDWQRTVTAAEVVFSTFDKPTDQHIQITELVLERAKRLAESKQDVVIMLDNLTRLARAYNLGMPASGKILSGGIDASALYPPRRFFGAARNIEEGGSITIIASALVETGSRMDDGIFEEFKGTGNMELRLDRQLAEKRIFPAINVDASSTRKEELLLPPEELALVIKLRRVLHALDPGAALELLTDKIRATKSNEQFLKEIAKSGS
ncbi:MAG TPA: transcription termination factor Rho [Actinomycetota bacterium]|nr:transcription termination factor Rho [Actinomycetota bacterium]